jgi:hypothetical protein
MVAAVYGHQKDAEELSRTAQTTNTIVAKRTLDVNRLAP